MAIKTLPAKCVCIDFVPTAWSKHLSLALENTKSHKRNKNQKTNTNLVKETCWKWEECSFNGWIENSRRNVSEIKQNLILKERRKKVPNFDAGLTTVTNFFLSLFPIFKLGVDCLVVFLLSFLLLLSLNKLLVCLCVYIFYFSFHLER
jgi:hypothetical protein